LPPTVHHHGPYRVWQRRFYDLNVWSEKKRLEKLTYMHGNPVKRGLVTSPDQWPWSSFRFYYLGDSSVLAMDPRPCSHTSQTARCTCPDASGCATRGMLREVPFAGSVLPPIHEEAD